MSHNHEYWETYLGEFFRPQLSGIIDTLEDRLLPAFETVSQEADDIADRKWQELMRRPVSGDEDPGDFADTARDAGGSHYMLMTGLRQGLINMFAAGLYHTLEQQALLFHRQELLTPSERDDEKLFDIRIFEKRLEGESIIVRAFPSWPVVDELRLVSNTVKHADGTSARKLHKLRTDLFDNPVLGDMGLAFADSKPYVFQPMIGEDLYVQVKDLHRYRDACLEFWNELLNALSQSQ